MGVGVGVAMSSEEGAGRWKQKKHELSQGGCTPLARDLTLDCMRAIVRSKVDH